MSVLEVLLTYRVIRINHIKAYCINVKGNIMPILLTYNICLKIRSIVQIKSSNLFLVSLPAIVKDNYILVVKEVFIEI